MRGKRSRDQACRLPQSELLSVSCGFVIVCVFKYTKDKATGVRAAVWLKQKQQTVVTSHFKLLPLHGWSLVNAKR